MNEKQAENDSLKEREEERVKRDLKRRPRARKHREIILPSGERKKRTDIGWEDNDSDE